jgi:Fe-S cluster assembly iron-binding protein IscA
MTLEESKTDEDTLDVEYGVSIIANKELTFHLSGSIIDFIDSPNGGGFQIRNGEFKSQIYGEFGYK